MASQPKVTQGDIAREAGVSQSVVSLAFGGRMGVVAESTRQAVFAAAERLGYRRRPAAVSSRPTVAYIYNAADRSRGLPAAIYDAVEMHLGRVADSFARQLSAAGFDMLLRPHMPGTDLTHWLAESNCAGVIWRGRDLALLGWIGERLPCVAVNRLDSAVIDTVVVDQEAGMRMALAHLQAAGHNKILLQPTRPYNDPLWQSRLRAFYVGLEMMADAEWVEKAREFSERFMAGEIDSIFDHWNDSGREATALIIGNVGAMQLLSKARQANVVVPEELSLLGSDNVPDGDMLLPRLTALNDPWEAVARTSVDVLKDRIANPTEPRKFLAIAPQLEIRDSVCGVTTAVGSMNA